MQVRPEVADTVRNEITDGAKTIQGCLQSYFEACVNVAECDEILRAVKESLSVCTERKNALRSELATERVSDAGGAGAPKPKTERKEAKTAKTPQIGKITAKVREDLGLSLERYRKKDGEESKLYLLRSTTEGGTKALAELFRSEEFAKIVHYKAWAKAYAIAEKNVEEFVKKTGLKVA